MKQVFITASMLFVLLFAAFTTPINAQTTIVSIGSNQTITNELPFYVLFNDAYTQMVYDKVDVGEAGHIGAITFESVNTQSNTIDELTIWMGHSDAEYISDNSWVPENELKQVYHTTNFVIPAGNHELTILLDSMFYYNGNSNLAICISQHGADFIRDTKFRYSRTNVSTCLFRGADNDSTFHQHPGTEYGNLSAELPNIKLAKSVSGIFCFPPQELRATLITENNIGISWENGLNITPCEVALLNVATDGTNFDNAYITTCTTNNYEFTQLTPNTTYKIGIRSSCGNEEYSDWVSIMVRTTPIPTELPYICDFESETSADPWYLDNAELTNHWVIDAQYASEDFDLYITDDTNVHSNTYSFAKRSNVFAKCLLRFDEVGEYNIMYDWRCMGENRSDYLRAMLVPASMVNLINSGNTIASEYTTSTLPDGFIPIDGGSKLNQTSTWNSEARVINIPTVGNYYLTFLWVNDQSMGTNPPAAIDNIIVERADCYSVDSIVVDNIMTDAVTINGYSASGSTFELCYRAVGTLNYDTLEINSPYILTGLTAGTGYEGVLRTLCDNGNMSHSSMAFEFQTECTTITLPWIYDAEGGFNRHEIGGERFPYCWETLNGASTDYYWTNTTVRDEIYRGSQSLKFKGTQWSPNYDEWLFSPTINFEQGGEITMWVKSDAIWGTATGRFAIYASTDDLMAIDDTAHYTQLTLTGVNASNNNIIRNNHVTFSNTQWRKLTITLPNTLTGDKHLAFVVKGVESSTFEIDDIYLYTPSTCPTPNNIIVTELGSTSAKLKWSGDASSYTVYYGEPGFRFSEAATVTTTDTTAELTNLNPNSPYEYRIIATCSDGVHANPSMAQTFKTACLPIANDNLPFIENFSDNETGFQSSLDPCWFKGTNNETAYPYVAVLDQDNSLLFASESNKYSYATIPSFEEDINNLVLSCSIYRKPAEGYTVYNSKISIGLMKNPDDINTFTPYDTLTPVNEGEWTDFQLALSDFDLLDGKYIAFVMPKGHKDEARLDNIKIELMGDCPAPNNVILSDVNHNDATITWNDEISSSWTVYYGAPGFITDTVSTPIVVNTTPNITLHNLNPQTDYEVCVVANCNGGSYSNESLRIRFTTACAPISTLPYIEDFESYESGESASLDPCWITHLIGPGNKYPFPSSSAKINGERGLYLKALQNSNTNYNNYVVLPLFEEAINNLCIKFNTKNSLNNTFNTIGFSKLAVGIMENPHDITTFDTLAICDMSNLPSRTVQTNEVLFDEYLGDGQYIALVAMDVYRGNMSYADNVIFVDDIEVGLIPTCQRPHNLTYTVTESTADITWDGNANDYEIVYSTNADMSDSTTMNVNGNYIQLIDLTPETFYYVNIRGICSYDDLSEWMTQPIKIRTLKDCGENYTNIIDTIGNGYAYNYYYPLNANIYTKDTRTWSIYTKDEMDAMGLISQNNLIHSIMLHTKTAGSPIPFKIYMKECGITEFSNDLSDTIPLGEMTLVYNGTKQFTDDTWDEITLNTPFQYQDTANLVIAFERISELETSSEFYYSDVQTLATASQYKRNYADYYTREATLKRGNLIFNFCAEIPNCVRPLNITYNNVSDTSVDLSWQGTANEYEIVYGTEAFEPSNIPTNINIEIVSTTQFTLQNLNPNNTYHLYIRSICGSDTSEWSLPIEFRTHCGALSLPFSENFDSYTADRNHYTMNPCWFFNHNGSGFTGIYPHISNNYAASAPNSYTFNSTPTAWSYATLPIIEDPINDITMTFKLYKADPEYGTLYIGVMDNPQDVTTFQHVATAQPSMTETWEEFEISLAGYDGIGKYIAFLIPDSIFSYVSMDDLEVFLTPSCESPIDVIVADSTITSSTAIVSWSDRVIDPAGGYIIEYGPTGFELGTGIQITSNSNPTTLTGLEHSSCYDVYVKTVCTEGYSSRWSIVTSFCTECIPIQLPVIYDFENEQAGADAPLPMCFNRFNDAADLSNPPYPYINRVAIYVHNGAQYLYFSMGTNDGQANNEAMIFPAIDTANFPMNNNQMVFWARGGNNQAEISVGIMSEPTDISSFVPLDTIILTDTYEEYTISFQNYTGDGIYPTILAYTTATSYSVYIDDVTIEETPTCPRANNLRAYDMLHNITTLDWDETSPASQWLIEYNIKDSTTIHSIIANTKPYTLTGLQEHTSYEFNVRPICSIGDTATAAVIKGEFTTLLEPANLPYAYDFEDANEWNKWQTNTYDDIVNWYRGTAVAGQGVTAMYISADNGVSCSSDWETTINAVAYRDIDFGPDTSSYTLTFMAQVGGSFDDLGIADEMILDELAVMLVDPYADVHASNETGVSPWGAPDTIAITELRHNTIWSTFTYTIDNVAGLQRLAFYWYNDFTDLLGCSHTDISCAIDSITITQHTCPRPLSLRVTELNNNSATIKWNSDASQFDIEYLPFHETNLPIRLTTQTDSITLTGLSENTDYKLRVRAHCSDNDSSIWSEYLFFTTNCGLMSSAHGINQDFDNILGAEHNVNGRMPACWESYANGENGVTPHVVDAGNYWYSHQDKALVMTAGSTYGDTSIVRLPYTIEPVNTLTLSYWMCTESSTEGTLEVGYITSPNVFNDFVTLKTIPASSFTKHKNANGQQSDSSGYWDTVIFRGIPNEAQAVAFRWTKPGRAYFSVSIDNVTLTSDQLCAKPVITNATSDFERIYLQWDGTSSEYQLLIKEASSFDWGDTITTIESYHNFTNLNPATNYKIKLRGLCGETTSSWTETEIRTESLACSKPTNLTISAIDYDHATLSWESDNDITSWVINIFNTLDNTIDTIETNPFQLNNLYDNTQYHVAVKNICTQSITSDWSDTLTFTTKTCPIVTNVTANDITSNSAVITWNSPEATKWQINCRSTEDANDNQTIDANETTHTLTSLKENTTYDVDIRSYCSENSFGQWSERLTFTTLESQEGIDGIDNNFTFQIYPNPTSGSTTIHLNNIEGKVTLSIIDMNGRIITEEATECGIDCEKRFDITGLAQGTYFVRVLGNNINSIRKLIIR